MLIDWFTVGAQVLNFVILIWLMKRFLYQPILNAIDSREKRIADELARADKLSEEASAAKTSFDTKNREFEQQRNQLMTDASDAANAERQRLMEDAHQTTADFEAKQQQALQDKMQSLQNSIRTTAQKELFSVAKNALRDLAAVDIESQMLAVFTQQLQNMSDEQKTALQAGFANPIASDSDSDNTPRSPTKITVLSSNPLSPEQEKAITAALDEFLGESSKLQFEQSPDLIGGIELSANGFKIGWSIAEYLHTLEDALTETMSTHINAATLNEPTPKTDIKTSESTS
ncbi:F0F1 ATP synthase subunit delta [Zhongshania borealis]|uniref:ATP synthase subunit b n=1 Tax=Zhongshania borealis TaxID=889488 RepID=A0ABP7W657_9GAMM